MSKRLGREASWRLPRGFLEAPYHNKLASSGGAEVRAAKGLLAFGLVQFQALKLLRESAKSIKPSAGVIKGGTTMERSASNPRKIRLLASPRPRQISSAKKRLLGGGRPRLTVPGRLLGPYELARLGDFVLYVFDGLPHPAAARVHVVPDQLGRAIRHEGRVVNRLARGLVLQVHSALSRPGPRG
jgi:hypothetical protein